MNDISAIILAAGKGTRMKSELPKVLHKAGGKPMIAHVLEACRSCGVTRPLLVVGCGAEEVQAVCGEQAAYVEQPVQLGTGHAVMTALPALARERGKVLVLCGDTPLLTAAVLRELLNYARETASACTLLSAFLPDPSGYGRVCRDADGRVLGVVEEKDATPQQKALSEVNTGAYCFDIEALRAVIGQLAPANAQGEYYLTDALALLSARGYAVNALAAQDGTCALGVNDLLQLSQAETVLRRRKNEELMLSGVTITDPQNTYIDCEAEVGAGTIIEPGSYIRGKSVVGRHCRIGPDAEICNSVVGDHTRVFRAVLAEARAGEHCSIGPFAYLRPGAILSDEVKIGDFVEVKKTSVGRGSKIPHLSYVGDSFVGERVNIGCGCVTCNYDGHKKELTVIEDGAFIGSNTNLIAPVTVGREAFVAAGSTITQNVPPDALSVARGRQRNVEGWAKTFREKNGKK
ncbi:MAG: bifunctional UDP-N-acetylglucosamine diphosphorylase/glucosamine-1-phosphate N-acetyltransferase GlmU [Clostridiales bacterium]|nr:bifunctional UDP-N-acetylglucosamine diphosphorylase/glucosamine-1-phosphate N-acetyltransferase GlmU [Clostridiales bacterium]